MTKTTKNKFQPLSERNVFLILDGGRNTGSFYEGIRTDQLLQSDYEDILEFCKFLDEVGGCGPINIQHLWSAFCWPEDPVSKMTVEHWKNEFAKYKNL
tara:strand:- start:197 stop:490 length:294 start_codon:yes stop_codon:yes gene_type:complete